MGSPMVFQTAPPQPASKARLTCSPQLVGGAEASQKGLGDWMPAVFAARLGAEFRIGSGTSSLLARKGLRNADGSPLAVGHGVDDLTTTIDAVASGEVFRVSRLASRAFNHNSALL